jgi:hypothetical protein
MVERSVRLSVDAPCASTLGLTSIEAAPAEQIRFYDPRAP